MALTMRHPLDIGRLAASPYSLTLEYHDAVPAHESILPLRVERLQILHLKCKLPLGSETPPGPRFCPADDFHAAVLGHLAQKNTCRLKELKICGSRLDGLGTFLASPCASKLERLTLKLGSMSQNTANELVSGLKQNQSVTHLKLNHYEDHALNGYEIGQTIGYELPPTNWEGLPLLATALRLNSNIQTLWLGNYFEAACPIVDNASGILSELRFNSVLTSLEIDSFLGADHGPLLLGMLVGNSTLQSLGICLQERLLVQDQNFRQLLSDGLATNTSLSSLCLKSTDRL